MRFQAIWLAAALFTGRVVVHTAAAAATAAAVRSTTVRALLLALPHPPS